MTPSSHRYFKEVEMREEGGTPAIIGSIRAGLVVQLKEAIGCQEIMAREKQLVERVFSKWKDIPEVHLCVMMSVCCIEVRVYCFIFCAHSWLWLVPIPSHGSLCFHSWYGTGTVADTSITTLYVQC